MVTFLWKSFWRWCNAAVFSHKRRRLDSWVGHHGRGWSWKRARSPSYHSHLSIFLCLWLKIWAPVWYCNFDVKICQTLPLACKFWGEFSHGKSQWFLTINKSLSLFCAKQQKSVPHFHRWLRPWWRWFLERRIIKIWRASFWQNISTYKFAPGGGLKVSDSRNLHVRKNMEMFENLTWREKPLCDLNLEFVIGMLNFMEGTCKVAFRLRKGARHFFAI